MRVATVCASTGLTLLAVAATACSGASSPGAAAPAGTATSAAAGSQSAGGSAGSPASVSKVNVCRALPAATVSQITGTTFTKTKPSNVEGVIFTCEYEGHLTEMEVSVAMQDGAGDLSADTSALRTAGYAPKKVAGVGDEAFAEPAPKGNVGAAAAASFASFGAVFGNTYINISGLVFVTPVEGTKIVEDLHSKL
jgi:hypothetical protein